jgi:NAD(P)-dependent dehydrogenase (short-subunit alcohol dehydrogenase family)
MGELRSAVITGASTGIGRATALRLDAAGFRVFAGVRRATDADSLRGVASERLVPIRLDVTDAAAVEAAAKSVEATVAGAGIQGLVNNAGIAVGAVLEFADLDDLRRQLEVNVVGAAAVTRAFLPLLRRGSGRIVNVSSNGGYLAGPFLGPYTASKFALEGMSDSLRRELRPWRIPVAVIEPGSIETPIWDKGRGETERVRRAIPEEGRRLYDRAFDSMQSYVSRTSSRAIPADAVARAIEHALTATRPRIRYRVGRDAVITRLLARFLPDRALDALVARLVGLR